MLQLSSFIISIDNSWATVITITTQIINDPQRLERWKISTFSSEDFLGTHFSVVFVLSLDFYFRLVFMVKIWFLYLVQETRIFCFFCSVTVECTFLLVKDSSFMPNNWFSQNPVLAYRWNYQISNFPYSAQNVSW